MHLLCTVCKHSQSQKYRNTCIFLITACNGLSPYPHPTNQLMEISINSKELKNAFRVFHSAFSVSHSGISVPAFHVSGFSAIRRERIFITCPANYPTASVEIARKLLIRCKLPSPTHDCLI